MTESLRQLTYDILVGRTGPLYTAFPNYSDVGHEHRREAGRFADRVADGENAFALRDDTNLFGTLILTNEVCEKIEEHREGRADDKAETEG